MGVSLEMIKEYSWCFLFIRWLFLDKNWKQSPAVPRDDDQWVGCRRCCSLAEVHARLSWRRWWMGHPQSSQLPPAVMMLNPPRQEDLTTYLTWLTVGFPGHWSTDTGSNRMPMCSCRQEDRLTSGASENPIVPFASKGCKACVQGPAAPWLFSGVRLSSSLLSFFFAFACIYSWFQRESVLWFSFPWLFPVTLTICCFRFATEVMLSQNLQVKKDYNTKNRFIKTGSIS